MITVCCAVIYNKQKHAILLARRSDTQAFEFPGGKLELKEDYEACIQREIQEELGVHFSPISRLPDVLVDTQDALIRLIPFTGSISSDNLCLSNAHTDYIWYSVSDAHDISWQSMNSVIFDAFTLTLHQ